MKIIFHTNIDAYQHKIWPTFENYIPRKGEQVYCEDEPFKGTNGKLYPGRLEVVQVRYKKGNFRIAIAYVELWFTDTDFQMYGGAAGILR